MEEYLNDNGNEINGTNGTDDPVAEPETAPAEVPEIGETAPTEAPDAAEERETAAAPGEGAAPIYGSTPAPEGAPAPEEAPGEKAAGPSPYFNNLTFRPREERPAGQEYAARQAQTPGYASYGAGQYQQSPQYAPYAPRTYLN